MSYSMSDSEQLIMEILWSHPGQMSIAEISTILQEKYGIVWKRQTINTFLARMSSKNLVTQTGRMYTYTHTIAEYKKCKAEEFLHDEYGGSLKNFVASLAGYQDLEEHDYEILLQYLKKYQ